MHSSCFEADRDYLRNEGEVLVAIAALVTEGRIPGKINKSRGFYEGPHCPISKNPPPVHNCDPGDVLCQKYETIQTQVLNLWRRNIPVCVEVFLTPSCSCENVQSIQDSTSEAVAGGLLLEQWYFTVNHHRTSDSSTSFSINQLISAVRSQLYFSQISAWLSPGHDENSTNLTSKNFKYRLAIPGETFESFTVPVNTHNFPATDVGNGLTLMVSLLSLPRVSIVPSVKCPKCEPPTYACPKMKVDSDHEIGLLDDRMHTNCTQKGKHRCEDLDDFYITTADYKKLSKLKRICNKSNNHESSNAQLYGEPSTSDQKSKLHLDIAKASLHRVLNDKRAFFKHPEPKIEKRNSSPNCTEQLTKNPKLDENHPFGKKIDLAQSKDVLNAIFNNGVQHDDQTDKQKSTNNNHGKCEKPCGPRCVRSDWTKTSAECLSDSICDSSCVNGDILKRREKFNIYLDYCDSHEISNQKYKKMRDISNVAAGYKGKARQRLTFEDYFETTDSKSTNGCDKEARKKETAVTVVKADKLSNPSVEIPTSVEQAKFRKSLDNAASMVFHSRTGLPLTSSPAPVRRGKCFDFDSSINSVSAIKSALFSVNFSTDEDSESDGSIVSPCSPDTFALPKREPPPAKYNRKGHTSNLLGSFEESVLNGRLEPVSTVHGFTAELGASGTFVPGHLVVPVTVFFYTLGDNDKVSSPYLGHINLGKKGYNVPKTGTVQVTLFNPLGTVVKMFVIMYDLGDMPPNSQTFIRQRTLYMPTNCQDKNLEWGPKWLRYLIHLRFMSSKSGRVYLHSDIRMIIFRKSDLDTATAHGMDMSYELRSFTHMPANPKYSPRK